MFLKILKYVGCSTELSHFWMLHWVQCTRVCCESRNVLCSEGSRVWFPSLHSHVIVWKPCPLLTATVVQNKVPLPAERWGVETFSPRAVRTLLPGLGTPWCTTLWCRRRSFTCFHLCTDISASLRVFCCTDLPLPENREWLYVWPEPGSSALAALVGKYCWIMQRKISAHACTVICRGKQNHPDRITLLK